MRLNFTKMHGCGNDYIYVNGFTQTVPQDQKPALVRRLSDRHFGIGGDGVIFINPSERADFEMEMYNADGSRAEMCGNGIRCVGKYVYDHGMTGGREIFTVESFGKVKTLTLTCRDGQALAARVNMGAPVLDPAQIPAVPSWEVEEGGDPAQPIMVSDPIEVGGRMWAVTCVSMGNPHAVVFPKEPVKEMDLSAIGPLFENHARFPKRINTEFVQIVDRTHVIMRVWERGTGETLACGTGACAVTVACVLNGLTERRLEVRLRGGILSIDWDTATNDVYLTGPAATVFEGVAAI